jgi:hypothetical protein
MYERQFFINTIPKGKDARNVQQDGDVATDRKPNGRRWGEDYDNASIHN